MMILLIIVFIMETHICRYDTDKNQDSNGIKNILQTALIQNQQVSPIRLMKNVNQHFLVHALNIIQLH